MLILTEFILATLGLVYLSFTITRNYNIVCSTKAASRPTRQLIIILGLGFTLASLIFALFTWGNMLGMVYWLATLTLSATMCVFALSFKPKILRIFLF